MLLNFREVRLTTERYITGLAGRLPNFRTVRLAAEEMHHLGYLIMQLRFAYRQTIEPENNNTFSDH